MAGPAMVPLVSAGPFLGVVNTGADIYIPPTKGLAMNNGDCEIIPKALTAKAGRVNLFSVSGLNGGVIGSIAEAEGGVVSVTSPGNPSTTEVTSYNLFFGSVPTYKYIANSPARFTWQENESAYIAPFSGNVVDLPFTDAVAVSTPLYGSVTSTTPSPLGYPVNLTTSYAATFIDNYGAQTKQVYGFGSDFAHFFGPHLGSTSYNLSTNPPLALSTGIYGGLQEENVWYALTYSAYTGSYPDAVGVNNPVYGGSGPGYPPAQGATPQGQETSPIYPSTNTLSAVSTGGTTVPMGISLNALGPLSVVLTPQNGFQWWGTFPNNSNISYVTNIYRYTSNLPVWNFIATVSPGVVSTATSSFTDVAPDSYTSGPLLAVSANGGPQLTFNRDVPPVKPYGDFIYATNTGYYPGAPMAYHQERLWFFAVVCNQDTDYANQFQLWYSNAGRPWEFDKVNNVFLVDLPSIPSYTLAASGYWPLEYSSNPYVYPYNLYIEMPSAVLSLTSVELFWTTKRMYILYGNDPSTYFFQKFADIGCISTNSVAYANTETSVGAFWMSESGIYYTNAQGIEYISEPIRALIEGLTLYDRYTCAGFYRDHTYYISFPYSNQTWAYKTTTGQWHGPLLYATPSAVDISSEPAVYAEGIMPKGPMNAIAAVRNGTNYVDSWFADTYSDLGNSQTVTYTSQDQVADSPHLYKTFCAVGITHTNTTLTGQICTVTVEVDDDPTKVCTVNFDLSQGPTQIATLSYAGEGGGDLQGFMAKLTITFSTASTFAPVIKNVTVYGNLNQYNYTPTVNMSTAGLS